MSSGELFAGPCRMLLFKLPPSYPEVCHPFAIHFCAIWYIVCFTTICFHIRPQTEENRASRSLCHTQASDRQISSWVGDHQRIPAVVCFFLAFYFCLSFPSKSNEQSMSFYHWLKIWVDKIQIELGGRDLAL